MGDMADFELASVIDAEAMRFDYMQGNMSQTEAYDLGVCDEHGSVPHPQTSFKHKSVSCKYCKSTNVKWVETKEGWRLFDVRGNKMHDCSYWRQS